MILDLKLRCLLYISKQHVVEVGDMQYRWVMKSSQLAPLPKIHGEALDFGRKAFLVDRELFSFPSLYNTNDVFLIRCYFFNKRYI